MGFFLISSTVFWSSRSAAGLLTVVSDRIARAFNRSRATRAVALDIPKVFDRVWQTGLLFSVIGGFESFWMVSLRKSI